MGRSPVARKRLLLWRSLAAATLVVTALLLFGASVAPDNPLLTGALPYEDKLQHCIGFLVLMLCIYALLPRGWWLMATLAAVPATALSELLQAMLATARTASIEDMAAAIVGIVLARILAGLVTSEPRGARATHAAPRRGAPSRRRVMTRLGPPRAPVPPMVPGRRTPFRLALRPDDFRTPSASTLMTRDREPAKPYR